MINPQVESALNSENLNFNYFVFIIVACFYKIIYYQEIRSVNLTLINLAINNIFEIKLLSA
ncbi:hypothetical protein BpHYR1_017146 [Brachionus plicatilis]|uniref:Uncharacterized protein n=1 Tax=Brachionus plicatilis TaxID=10195 RepID=A0A3M7QKW0_BRAPC|nr:hypothetical protein BpHYR1_017146 [Brachionus plicatilis]